jgi:hypothetical protein
MRSLAVALVLSLVAGCKTEPPFSWTEKDKARLETFVRTKVRDAVDEVSRDGHAAWLKHIRQRSRGGPFEVDGRIFRYADQFRRYVNDSLGPARPQLEVRNMRAPVLSPYDILFSADIVERDTVSGREIERAAFLTVLVERDSAGTYFASIMYRRLPGPPKDRGSWVATRSVK